MKSSGTYLKSSWVLKLNLVVSDISRSILLNGRDIVKAAHLKPVNKSDAERKKDLPQIRNSVASKNQECACTSLKPFSDSCAFMNRWRKLDIQQRSALLYDLGPSGLIERIGVSISTTLLKEIFEVLIQADEQRLIQTVQLLQALTRVERFAIIVCFLNSEESTACRRLFQKLSADYIQQKKDSAKLVKLKELYLVL